MSTPLRSVNLHIECSGERLGELGRFPTFHQHELKTANDIDRLATNNDRLTRNLEQAI
jgi:hypothetical protein